MKRKLKNLLINLSLLGSSLIMAGGLGEMFLRVLAPPPFERHHQSLFVEYDPTLGWRKIPGKTAKHVTSEYEITESINSKGLRGPEYPYAKDSSEYRVLVLGDSFVEGYTVEFDELFTEVLRRRLNDSGQKRYTVVNAGTGGYSTDQELLYFEQDGYKYHPDLTILMFYANDVLYNNRDRAWRGYKPVFVVRDKDLVLTNIPVPPPDTTVAEADTVYYGSLSQRVRGWLNDHSRLYATTRNVLLNNYNLHKLAVKLGFAKKLDESEASERVPDELLVWQKDYSPEVKEAWRVTEAVIGRLKQRVEAAGSELMVFYVPISAAIDRSEWEATVARYFLIEDQWSIDQVCMELESICARNDIDFVDPTSRFRREAETLEEQNQRLYFKRDRHWTATGHRLAADIMAEHVKRRHAPEPPPYEPDLYSM
ncbi:MAG: SGNH/GDSL hydrolase family protein [Candidatus Zixiibacteriota bacterium]|nr:MAG: SGNH/GDSL hydrolase family protein [candidate division Zixibacteria bacterium]